MVSRLVRWLQPLALVLSILAIAWYLRTEWATLAAYPWRLDGAWLAVACALLLVTWALEIEIWRQLLGRLSAGLGWFPALRIWFLSAIVRYVPGNIWQPLSLTLYCRRYGIAPEATVASILIFQVIVVLATAPFAAAYLAWPGGESLMGRRLLAEMAAGLPVGIALMVMAPLLLCCLRPQWLFALLNWGLEKFGRPPLPTHLTAAAMLGLVAVAALDWLLWGATFAAFTFGVTGAAQQTNLTPILILSYPIAYTVGFLSVITPSGFGVREGALSFLIAPLLDGAVVTVVALAMRVWTMLGELLLALVSAPYEHGPQEISTAPATGTATSKLERSADAELRREPT
jgi:hypothetical protein